MQRKDEIRRSGKGRNYELRMINYELFLRGDFVLGLAVVIPTPTSTCGGPFASQLCVSRRNYYLVFLSCFYFAWGYNLSQF